MTRSAMTETLRETLACFDPGRPLGTTEVAERLDLGRRATYERLERLVDHDRLETKAIGANARVWWRPATAPQERAGRDWRAETGFEYAFDAHPDLVYVFDSDRSFVRWNDRLSEVTGYDDDAIESMGPLDLVADRSRATCESAIDRMLAGERLTLELPLVTAAGGERTYEVAGGPVTDETGEIVGATVIGRDVGDRVTRERRLERRCEDCQTKIDALSTGIDGGFLALDDDWRISDVDEWVAELVDGSIEELTGSTVWDTVTDLGTEPVRAQLEAAAAAEESIVIEQDADGLGRWLQVQAAPSPTGLWLYLRDVTDRKVRERTRQRYETIVETVDDGLFVLDADGRFVTVNEAYVELTGYQREELLGSPGSRVLSDAVAADFVDRIRGLGVDGEDSAVIDADLHRADGTRVPTQTRFSAVEGSDGRRMTAGITRDVSDRVDRERELRNRICQQQAVTDLGQRALEAAELDDVLGVVAEQVVETLEVPYCIILQLDAAGEELVFREWVGWDGDCLDAGRISATDDDSQAAYTLDADQPVVVEDLTTEWRFSGPGFLRAHDVRSGITTAIGPSADPWGILGVHATEAGALSAQDATFLRAVSNVLTAAIERHRHERELVHQREQLAVLNSLSEVVRDVTDAVIDRSTRGEIETAVCDRLAGTDSYRFAWIGDLDSTTGTVESRYEAGFERDTGDPVGQDPCEDCRDLTKRASRSGAVQISTADGEHTTGEFHGGAQSLAAIPIGHAESVYCVLVLGTDRPGAFAEREWEVIAQLGGIVGHAIAAAERKQALMSDELVEVAFQVEDVFASVDSAEASPATLTLDRAVPIEDGEYLAYGTASPDAVEAARATRRQCPHWEAVTVRSEDPPHRIEICMTEPPVISAVAARGGYLDRARVDDGTLEMCIHLPPTADVRAVMATVEETYPDAEMLRRRQITRERDDPHRFKARVVSRLTDRQQATLEAAYHAGFFEWPRDTTGEDVAASLGVSAPTFHQHLRTAQRKVLDGIVSGQR